ncbi:MAG: ferric reductase-like transmembrane domain-containing protein [Chloroflexi bacterium]|nr:ferric reductase-like transmembrane domain-containing protein [Chloroflexota bacterium]
MQAKESSTNPNSWLRQHWHRVLAHTAGLFTLAWLVLEYALQGDSFTFNRTLMLRTGSASLALLVASFACTPLSRLLGWPRLVQVRRALGLYGFFYALGHVWNYAVFEAGLTLELILRDLEERRAMLIGLIALALLIPLALTSTRGWQQRLGKHWSTLHRLVYVAVPLSVWHYLWLDRDIITLPLIYAIVVGGLLALRLGIVRRALRRLFMGKA